MARFWTRLFHGKKKKLPVIVFDDYAQSKHLSESYMYGKHLVRVDKLQHAYCHLQQQQQQKSQAPFWRFMDPFIQTWHSELERVCRTSQSALIMLNTQLEEVSNTICFIVSRCATYTHVNWWCCAPLIVISFKESKQKITQKGPSVYSNVPGRMGFRPVDRLNQFKRLLPRLPWKARVSSSAWIWSKCISYV